ncbi:NUDIX hydrolase domain-like protein [Thelephora terrestris]|uniref:NUDIX hydrolase domain-like protein n=1 Tax=Thelephora terrestris TaxID=56493 RepID=A0A9P6HND4_9AGAM|nr:NUDIX hydrolase domain-like protein [Thelephora terrestris]
MGSVESRSLGATLLRHPKTAMPSASVSIPPQITPEEIDTLPGLSSESRECIRRLCDYKPPQSDFCPPEHTGIGRAAVLVLLFEREGSLRVLLTTRSKELHSRPGLTVLPGGKYESTDESLVATAYREASEEVGLDIKSPHLRTVVTLPPFFSSRKYIVTPTVAVLTDPSLLNTLAPLQGEVDTIFDHPVKAFLDPTIVPGENVSPVDPGQWVRESEFHDFRDFIPGAIVGHGYRMHRFHSTGSPITGLTADFMVCEG